MSQTPCPIVDCTDHGGGRVLQRLSVAAARLETARSDAVAQLRRAVRVPSLDLQHRRPDRDP